ncbi:MAG: four helix bundle protein [Chloroflexi bacterium]|nr:four helix bundle protein [Chloroflexota bacterium]MCI0649827.1 four helix bundle protein [Chloroflexota bacterium]MCI0729124.1 four helix bundle protein [Chloroflexota bacterium]
MGFAKYEEWLAQVHKGIKKDRLWGFETYRKALFLADLAWLDGEKLLADPRGRGIAWQLIDSAGSVAANIEEGFGRGFGKDYARFLRISLGSARETRGWYYRGRHVFEPLLIDHRLQLTNEIIGSLVAAAEQQRHR